MGQTHHPEEWGPSTARRLTCSCGHPDPAHMDAPTVAMNPIAQLGQAISDALDAAPAADVLSVLTGAFVGLTVELCRRQGHDTDREIKVDGGKQRDITIHPPKG